MAKKATKDQKIQLETLSQIDSLITILGDYPESTLPLTMDVNPFGFLIDICKSLGIYDELITFLAHFIENFVPLAELAIKGILLANLKEMVSCSDDPFIPRYLRKQINDTNTSSGITFNLSDIDYNNLMGVNPLDEGSEYLYLGIDREFCAWYVVYAPTTSTVVKSVVGSQTKDKIKAQQWLDKKIAKFTSTYQDTEEIKYEISGNIETYYEDVTKKNKETITIEKYEPTVWVESHPKKEGGKYVDLISYFDTQKEAKEFVRHQKSTYNKTYNPKKTGCIIDYGVKPIIYTTPYELARAKDFNAFLWFITHMADFNSPIRLKVGSYNNTTLNERKAEWANGINSSIAVYQVEYTKPNSNKEIRKNGPLGVLKFHEKENMSDNVPPLLGTTFVISDNTDSSMYDLCISEDITVNDEGGVENIEYIVVPATSDLNSLNWYGDRSKYFDFLKYWSDPQKEAEESPRDYSHEIGICNIEFNSTVTSTPEYSNYTRNLLRFTVLPKPLMHIPQWISGDMPWNYKMLLFNTLGEYDSKGKYSVFVTKLKDPTTMIPTDQPDCQKNDGSQGISVEDYPCYYILSNKTNVAINNGKDRLYIPKKWSNGIITYVNGKKGTTIPFSCLYECYPNLTVYEFNYDYVMSQRLLDAKVIIGELLDGLMNMRIGLNSGLNFGILHTFEEGALREVIIDMTTGETETYSVNDCFDKFSNAKYDALLRQTEEKKVNGYHFEGVGRTTTINTNKITEILNELDNPDYTKEERVDIIKGAFQEAIVSITEETEDMETWDIKFNFILNLILNLIFALVKSLLTPKILILLAVNKQLMGNWHEWTGNAFDNLLQILLKIIGELIKEIKDMLLKQLLDFVLGFLKPKFAELAALIVKEYIEQYRDQIAALIKACGFGWGWGIATADTKLDKVTYADIDPIKEIINDNQC